MNWIQRPIMLPTNSTISIPRNILSGNISEQQDMQSDDIDALDAFMKSIKSGVMDTKTRIRLKRELLDLQKDFKRVEKLMNVAKPNLPNLSSE